jgi:hypothetical protein
MLTIPLTLSAVLNAVTLMKIVTTIILKNLITSSVLSINIQSLPSKFFEFSEMIAFMSKSECNPDIICIQETWKIADPDQFCLPGYHHPLFKLREQKQGGGVAIYVKDIHTCTVIEKYSSHIDKVLESLFVEIRTSCKKRYIIGNIYRTNAKYMSLSEKFQFDTFMDFLNNILADCNDSNIPSYIAGDFNINVLNYDHDNLVSEYVNNIFLHGFLQIVTKPTRCTSNSATLIDHVLTNDIKSSYECNIITCKMSDHFPVVLYIGKDTRPRDDTIKSRFMTENNISNFKYFPVREVRLNRNIHKLEKWYTTGLLVSRRRKLYLAGE